MSRFGHLPQTGGIEIEVAFPRWLILVVRMLVALLILGILGLILFALAFARSRESSVSTGPALAVTVQDFSARPVHYEVRLTAGSEAAKDLDREWTLLMSSGAIHWANVVEGPTKLAPGESATLTLTFLFDPQPQEGDPVALRWDPGRKVGAWIGLSR